MSEELGRIERPEAERFKQRKKIYLVPLIYDAQGAPEEYKDKCRRYWQQVEEQLNNLSTKIGRIKHVYHETIFQSGQEGIKAAERMNPGSYEIVRRQCENGASFEAVEAKELFEEVLDWQRCLMLGLISPAVANKVSEFYAQAARKRNEFIARRISETLGEGEAGLLFISEGHGVQFPQDVEVFNVFPPALDEIRRWLRDQASLEVTRSQGAGRDSDSKTGRSEGAEPKGEEQPPQGV